MKFTIPKFQIGQRVAARVEDIVSTEAIIVNFAGDLLRVSNKTGRKFKLGEAIQLEVRQLKPLQFQLVDNIAERSSARPRAHFLG